MQHDGYLLPNCALESLSVRGEVTAELGLVDAIEPAYLLSEKGGEVSLAAEGGLALSGDEPAGDHEPPSEEGSAA